MGKGSKRITYLRLGEWTVEGLLPRDKQNYEFQEFRISEDDIKVHENYKKKFSNIENDIALIRLPQKATLNYRVQFACLPVPESTNIAGIRNWNADMSGENAVVVGWGHSCYENNTREFCSEEHIGSKRPQHLEVKIKLVPV